jgi:hypothetical protein
VIWEGKGRPVDQKECSHSQTVRNRNDFSILKTEHDSLVVGDRPNLEAILTEWGLTRQIWNKANVDSQIRLLAAAHKKLTCPRHKQRRFYQWGWAAVCFPWIQTNVTCSLFENLSTTVTERIPVDIIPSVSFRVT